MVGLRDPAALETIAQRGPQTRVVALEPDPKAAQAVLRHARAAEWRASGRLLALAGPDYAGHDQAWKAFPSSASDFKLVVDPALGATPETVAALRIAKGIIFGARANAEARARFAPIYLQNVLRNAPAIARGGDVRTLAGGYAGLPAVIAAAGPSLDGVIDDLREATGRALLIAVDTALRPLLHAGIAPSLVVGADPSAANARHFHGLPDCRDTWLVAESALQPGAASAFPDRTLWFRLAAHHPWPWLNAGGLDIGRLDMWGSVLTAAFGLACFAGCDPIVLVGADLAYTGGQPYCRGTTYEFDWSTATASGLALADAWKQSTTRPDRITTRDVRGAETLSTKTLVSFRDWMVAAAGKSGRRVINAGGAGILHGDGIEQSTLRAALPQTTRIRPIAEIVDRQRVQAPALDEHLRRLRRDMDAASGNDHEPVRTWLEFAGAGLDRAAIRAALDPNPAGGALPANPTPPDWAGERPAQGGAHRVFDLPETLARLRSIRDPEAAGGRPGPDEGAPSISEPAAQQLLHALTMLRHVVEGLAQIDGLPVTSASRQTLVSARFGWPDRARWGVQMFESLLADVWERPSVLPERTFFTGPVAPPTGPDGMPPSAPDDRRRTVTQASVLLLLDWFRALSSLRPGDPSIDRALERLVSVEALFRSRSRVGASAGDTRVLVHAATSAGATERIVLPLGVAPSLLSRVLTGFVLSAPQPVYRLLHLDAGAVRIDIDVLASDLDLSFDTMAPAPILQPQLLTDGGVPRATLCHLHPGGVVCVAPSSRASFLVDREGHTRPHMEWPRPIVGQLPFGTDGAVAWGYGDARWPDVRSGYVMYRRGPHDAIETEELPVAPGVAAAWWNGRVYWGCMPCNGGTWAGLASWAPGEPLRFELPDVTLYGIHPCEDHLELHPRWMALDRLGERRRQDTGWRWRPGADPVLFELGPLGAASSRSLLDGWTAVAYPEADRVQITAPDGRVTSLVCHHPVRLAWLGPSLLVSTGSADLLLFRDPQHHAASAFETREQP